MRSTLIYSLRSLLSLAIASLGATLLLCVPMSAAQAQTQTSYATVWRIQGDVTATAADAAVGRKLALGDVVFVNEKVRTEATAEVVFQTADAGLIALRPGAAFVAERFVAQGKATDHATLRVLQGGLRLITGWIARVNRRDYRIVTATATIGVRGTDHEPYVVTDALAQTLSQAEGTYDKVNRGGTVLETNGNLLNIDSGKVGFARTVKPIKTRALMTLVLPVLLEKVPTFYVPGQFDAELDQLSANSENTITRQLAEQARVSQCDAKAIARNWLGQLDGAIAKRDAQAVLHLFANGVLVRANVRDQRGELNSVELSRDEFAQSTITAVKALTNYKQRRLSVTGQVQPDSACGRVNVTSLVIEQGKQNGKPYRFESTEVYVLERQDEKWLAVSATTTQK